jgi:hypothetical protein
MLFHYMKDKNKKLVGGVFKLEEQFRTYSFTTGERENETLDYKPN